jgi:hypothetical protein
LAGTLRKSYVFALAVELFAHGVSVDESLVVVFAAAAAVVRSPNKMPKRLLNG